MYVALTEILSQRNFTSKSHTKKHEIQNKLKKLMKLLKMIREFSSNKRNKPWRVNYYHLLIESQLFYQRETTTKSRVYTENSIPYAWKILWMFKFDLTVIFCILNWILYHEKPNLIEWIVGCREPLLVVPVMEDIIFFNVLIVWPFV